MFLSPNTLYLAVWNVTHGEEGVESLRRWLLNIQVKKLLNPSRGLSLRPLLNTSEQVLLKLVKDATKKLSMLHHFFNYFFNNVCGNVLSRFAYVLGQFPTVFAWSEAKRTRKMHAYRNFFFNGWENGVYTCSALVSPLKRNDIRL